MAVDGDAVGGAIDDETGVAGQPRRSGRGQHGDGGGLRVGVARAVSAGRGGTARSASLGRQHPRAQLTRAERFGDDVVGADAESEDRIGLFGEGGDQQDVGVAVLADAAGGLIPVDARHVHVEGGDVGVVGTDGIHAVETVVDREDVETGAREHLDEEVSNVGIIVDDDGGLPCGLAHRRPPCCVCWSDCARLRGPLPRRSRRGCLLDRSRAVG